MSIRPSTRPTSASTRPERSAARAAWSVAVLLLALAPSAAAQGDSPAQVDATTQGLVATQGVAPTPPEPLPAPEAGAVRLRALSPVERLRFEVQGGCFDAERWRARLTDPDLDRRERAFEELVGELDRCTEGVATLEAWSASLREPQLSWTARLALRELRRRPRALVLCFPPSASTGIESPIAIDLKDPSRVGAQLELLEGPLSALFHGNGELSLYAPRRVAFQGPPPAASERRSFSVEAGPERVTLRITESSGGEERTREYSAGSLAELLAERPELAREVPGLSDMAVQPLGGESITMRWSNGPVRLRVDPFGLHQRPLEVPLPDVPQDAAPPTAQVLGVKCAELADEERAARGLSAGVGLHVLQVARNSIAEVVELRRGDILLRIDSTDLRECDDIGRALAARAPDQPLVIDLVDTSGQRRSVSWRPGR